MSSSTFSGVVLNQNQPQSDTTDWLNMSGASALYPSPTLFPAPTLYPSSGGSGYYQTFQLPSTYARESVIPDLTGFQLYVNVASGQATEISLGWELDVQISNVWTTLASGTQNGTATDGMSWMNVYFPSSVPIQSTWLTNSFRLVLVGQGTFSAGYTDPNPLTTGQLFFTLNNAPVVDVSTVSFMFRLLANVADSGTDFLGNTYRSSIVSASPSNVSTVNTSSSVSYWLSQPNPSQFAVESLYLDQRVNGSPAVIDRLTVDPLTPGVFFHIYYSNDPAPGTNVPSWENLIWTPVYKTFQASRKTTYALPEPISAKYIKVEFTSLQARSYDPGQFQLPTTFKKHPKWVLDYFLARFAAQDHNFVSSSVAISYDALDLAFAYYTGDLTQDPNPPTSSEPLTNTQVQFFAQENANMIDPQILHQIKYAFQPFSAQPALLGRFDSIIGNYTQRTVAQSYPVESIQSAVADTSVVSNLNREPLLVEKGFPVMFFYIPCRHGYRISQAMYETNTAYFAGVKSLTFHREIYAVQSDQTQYNEILGDGANIAINDFL